MISVMSLVSGFVLKGRGQRFRRPRDALWLFQLLVHAYLVVFVASAPTAPSLEPM